MKTWIALLRGINVGGHHLVRMKDLARHLETDGFREVRTYIQSGNVVLKSQEPPGGRLADLIERHFGFRPAVLVLSAEELRQAADRNPFDKDGGKKVHLFFCEPEPPQPDFGLLEALKGPAEDYRLSGRVFYLYAPDGIGRSRLAEKIGKALPGTDITARNLNTINKLLEMSA
jgi:uncharacterized protein (DUF1697 family)